ncbi:hypothetical protein J437_LFUL012717 [Ladona fulva]|uniref:Farnesol dehydrogenase n=1 Tax=Ladona fulva TaxID=123851 RepID=A0A8K0KQN6_LADFU|nr:hypothetical protein J437_LFUL012717 [Ladona fulva]
MERWAGKVAVVTGASAGIGAAIAKELVRHGMKVVGMARRVERVEAIAKELNGEKGKLYPYKGDVMEESDVKAMFQWIREEFGAVHVLVNNAGAAREVPMTGGANYEHMRIIFGTNVFGLFMCTSEALDVMNEKGIDDGHIIHINR